MSILNYNSQVKDVLLATALGTTSSNAIWCRPDDMNLFYDTESYKQDTNFTSSQAIQQVMILNTKAQTIFTIPQKFSMSINGVSTIQSGVVDKKTENIIYNTTAFSNIRPSNGDTLTLQTDSPDTPYVTSDSNLNENKIRFIVKQVDFPSDVTFNYNTTGPFYVYFNPVLCISGNIKTGDTIEIKRSKNTNRPDITTTIIRDTKSIGGGFYIQQDEELSVIYKHKVTQVPRPITYTSDDSNISWLNATTTNGTNETNIIQFSQGSYVDSTPSNFNINITYQDNTTKQFAFELPATTNFKTYSNQTITLPDLTNATSVTIPKQSKLIQTDLQLNLQNCDVIVPQVINDDYGVNRYYLDKDNRTITVKAHSGYTFNIDGEIKYKIYDNASDQTITLTANNSDTITTTLPDNFNPLATVTLTIGATKPTIVENTGGFVNFYKADYQSLLNFSNDYIEIFGNKGTINVLNLSNYVSNLIMLPFDIPTKLVDVKSAIVAGNQAFKTEMSTINDSHYIYDLGTISTPEVYKNGYDYYQVKTRLVLPFTDTVELDPKHVINKTITIKYDVVFQNGDTTVIISNEDGVFFTKSFNIGNEIPFVTTSTNGNQNMVINKLQERFNNEVYQSYILIEQPTPVLNNNYYDTIERGQLKAYTGNVKAELLNNVTNVPSDELNQVQNILENGVKIK